jgi:hypothetical protein
MNAGTRTEVKRMAIIEPFGLSRRVVNKVIILKR